MNISKKTLSFLVAASAFTGFAGSAMADAASDQIAIQLGAIQLGYPNGYRPGTNPVWDASALKQGQLALAATSANFTKSILVVSPIVTNRVAVLPNPQSEQFRSMYLAAAQAALTNPATAAFKSVSVTTTNPAIRNRIATTPVTGTLNMNLLTPSQIVSTVVTDMPNFAPAIASNAVAASMLFTTTNVPTGPKGSQTNTSVVVPLWGKSIVPKSFASVSAANTYSIKTAGTQVNNAAKAASTALAATCKAYANGTQNWSPFPKVGTNAGTYLPNFGTTYLGPTAVPSSNQAPDQKGLSDAASAIAANAINGLRAPTNVTGSLTNIYGLTQSNVTTMTASLVGAAKAFQTTSTRPLFNAAGQQLPSYESGSVGASTFGITTQVSGNQNDQWGNRNNVDAEFSILTGVVNGSIKAVGKTSSSLLTAVAYGISQGFAVAYITTTYRALGSVGNYDAAEFLSKNIGDMVSSFQSAAGFKSGSTLYTAVQNALTGGINNAFTGFSTNTGTFNMTNNYFSGQYGINLQLGTNALINGVGTPVTDTTGL